MQFLSGFFFCLSRKPGHIGQVNPRLFIHGKRQCFYCRIHTCHRDCFLDRPPGKDIRFPHETSIIIQDFQGTQQAVGIIFRKRTPVPGVANHAKFFGIGIVGLVQPPLRFPDFRVGCIPIHLHGNQFPHTVPDLDHSLYTLFCCWRETGRIHHGILPIVYGALYNCIAVIPHSRIRRYSPIHAFLPRLPVFYRTDSSTDFLQGCSQQFPQLCPFHWLAGSFCPKWT